MQRGACRGSAPQNGERERDRFFPRRGETAEEAILKFCFGCKVRKECDDYADRMGATVGVWGGRRRTRMTHGSGQK